MKIVINEGSSITNIKTVVLYKFYKYIPDAESDMREYMLGDHRAYEIRYLGNTENLSDNDLSEYGLSFLVEKDKFNDNQQVSFLDNHSKNIIGKEVEDIMLLNKVMVPTNSKSSSEDYSYFGSAIFNYTKYYLFNLDENIYKIELYDGVIDKNNTTDYSFVEYDLVKALGKDLVKPSLVITFGPDKLISRNPDTWYYGDEVNNKYLDISIPEYKKVLDELVYKKFLYISLPESGKEDIKVNLVYESWLDDNKNPLRNLNKTLLRNDEKYEICSDINPIKSIKNSNYLIDINSGTLLSNKPILGIDNCPILKRKINKLSTQNIEWNPNIRYGIGNKVEYLGISWISLSENNLGNLPILSSDWEEEGHLTNFYTNRLEVSSDKSGRGIITPSGMVTLEKDVKFLEFTIKDFPGYEFNSEEIKVYPKIDGKSAINRISDTGLENYKYFKSQDWGHIVLFEEEFINNVISKVHNLYFCFNLQVFNLLFDLEIDNGDSIDYPNWNTWYELNKDDFFFRVNNNLVAPIDNKFRVSTEDNISISVNSMKYRLVDITDKSNNSVSGNFKIIPTKEDELLGYIPYTVKLINNILSIAYSEFNNFIVDNVTHNIGYGESCEFRFYPSRDIQSNEYIEVTLTTPTDKIILKSLGNYNLDGMKLSFTKTDDIYSVAIDSLISSIDVKLNIKTK